MSEIDKNIKKAEEKEPEVKKKSCFIITPIGDVGSDINRHINGVIKSVIRPILKDEFDFGEVRAAHEIDELGSINNQIIDCIMNDDLVIANLTGNNPNVMYELCLRHATAKPVIHICENGTRLPFDIKGERTVFYSNDMMGCEELKENLRRVIGLIDYGKEYMDNPIYTAININKVIKDSGVNDPMTTIINMLQDLRADHAYSEPVQWNPISHMNKTTQPYIIDTFSEGLYEQYSKEALKKTQEELLKKLK